MSQSPSVAKDVYFCLYRSFSDAEVTAVYCHVWFCALRVLNPGPHATTEPLCLLVNALPVQQCWLLAPQVFPEPSPDHRVVPPTRSLLGRWKTEHSTASRTLLCFEPRYEGQAGFDLKVLSPSPEHWPMHLPARCPFVTWQLL